MKMDKGNTIKHNGIVFEPSTAENTSKIEIKHSQASNIVMESKFQEENNNNIESVIKGFEEMGNISKNLAQCSKKLENCTNGSGDIVENSKTDDKQSNVEVTNDPDYDSEEFDEYKEEEDFTKKLEDILASPSKNVKPKQVTIQQLPKSANSVQSRSKSRMSVGSSNSSVVKRHPKINMSFTNDRSKQIERENNILLKKILNAKSDKVTTPEPPLRLKSSNSAVSRKRLQEKIQHDNLIILKKIQKAKSSNLSLRR